MSLSRDGQRLICDGGCGETAPLPVALRSVLAPRGKKAAPKDDGWLFVLGEKGWKHFCPRCALPFMKGLHTADIKERGGKRTDSLSTPREERR